MAKSRRRGAPRDRKRPFFEVPKGPCDPEPPKRPPPPSPGSGFDRLWPDALDWLKLGKKKR